MGVVKRQTDVVNPKLEDEAGQQGNVAQLQKQLVVGQVERDESQREGTEWEAQTDRAIAQEDGGGEGYEEEDQRLTAQNIILTQGGNRTYCFIEKHQTVERRVPP